MAISAAVFRDGATSGVGGKQRVDAVGAVGLSVASLERRSMKVHDRQRRTVAGAVSTKRAAARR
jgi:hypothetical protein